MFAIIAALLIPISLLAININLATIEGTRVQTAADHIASLDALQTSKIILFDQCPAAVRRAGLAACRHAVVSIDGVGLIAERYACGPSYFDYPQARPVISATAWVGDAGPSDRIQVSRSISCPTMFGGVTTRSAVIEIPEPLPLWARP